MENKDMDIKDRLNNLVKDEDFCALVQKYEAPNCVTIMSRNINRRERREESHSNFVSWLLDPKENHGLGTFALERFLSILDDKNIDSADLENIKFERERDLAKMGRVDIFAMSPTLIIVIENKVNRSTGESMSKLQEESAQTERYFNYCEENFSNRKRIYIHLTANPINKLENEKFKIISYQQLYDRVIKEACIKCKELKKNDTKYLLEQYVTDISNPILYEQVMAYVDNEEAKEIYRKHEDTFELLRNIMKDTNKNKLSYIREFFEKYKLYINELILPAVKKKKIKIRTGERLEGQELVDALIEDGYVIPDETELFYHRPKDKTCIIILQENGTCKAGVYGKADYDGTQDIKLIMDGEKIKLFENYHKAAVEVEKFAGYNVSNGGITPQKFKLLKAGIKEANMKTIQELYQW